LSGEHEPRSPELTTAPALITISTRASLKRYHTYNLALGEGEQGGEWTFERIGTESEKMHVEKELRELRERLAQVETWKARRQEIEDELARVWVDGGDALEPPPYAEKEAEKQPEEKAEEGIAA
jgi:ATP-binding cassette subfamily D (ALD) long-chain fatty acid import protein